MECHPLEVHKSKHLVKAHDIIELDYLPYEGCHFIIFVRNYSSVSLYNVAREGRKKEKRALLLLSLSSSMVPEGTKRAKVSAPRAINVQTYAETRLPELKSLQTIVENRVNNDYRSQRNKRRRTTAFQNKTARRKKNQLFGGVVSEKDEIKKVPRRVRRRNELKKNPENGFCVCGDGTKRLRTHVWHAKRFSMTKLWGFNLPLGLPGRGKGSRALLKRLKQGVLVHDASYYTAIQLEGPEDSLVSVLGMVLEPSPATHPENHDGSVVSGTKYGTAMLYRIGAPVSQAIAPVTYMWHPISQQNMSIELDGSNESMKVDIDFCEKSDRMQDSALFRQLWVWIHASAFQEGYDNLKLACQKEIEKRGISINCVSLEGRLAKIELMGSGTFQLLQRILHPAKRISENHFQLRKHVATEEDYVSQNKRSFSLKNEEYFSSHAMLSLNVMDPRDLPGKRTVFPTDSISTEALSDAQEKNYKKLDDFEGMLEKNTDLSWSKLEESHSDFDDLWYATARVLKPPVDDSVLCKEKHRKHLVNFCLDDIDSGENSSTKVQCSRSCPILLLKNAMKELVIGWSIILPLSWVKAFWIPLISNGAHGIGLREKHWIACEMGLPLFPSDFPDCKAYSCFMEAKATEIDKKADLRPPSKRQMRVPILPPWHVVRFTLNKEIVVLENSDVSTRKDLTNANSLPNTSQRSFKISKFDSENNSFDGTVARTGCMLTTFLDEAKAGQLLLFPYSDRKARISKFLNGELKLDPSHRSTVIYDHKLCFLRVHLHPFKEGFFEEGAVICAPCPSDISIWTLRSGKSEDGLQMPQSALGSYFKEHPSGKWEMQIPDDSIARESHRWPIGFVTTACVQGCKRLVAGGFCEAVLLARLREEQWKEKQRRKEIYVLVRNLRSVAYRLALASVVLEYQENDVEFL
ncbi:hypothetical protein RIF29_22329 [Crotalaria pallida]|uniref:Uncharacterized protein n=1 Tax=Crotalaria pallida TaxID=3830 RepID=A0AAN9F8L4_CROPI